MSRSSLVVRLLLTLAWTSAACANPIIELQRYSDQLGESPRKVLISPDQTHFYVLGVTDIVGHRIFPAGFASPREVALRGASGSLVADAVFSDDSRFLYVMGNTEILIFERATASGALSLTGTYRDPRLFVSLRTSSRLAIAPGGAHLYALEPTQISHLNRDRQTGMLSLASKVTYRLPEPDFTLGGIAVSTSGDELFAVGHNALVVFDRDLAAGELAMSQSVMLAANATDDPLALIDDNTLAVALTAGQIDVLQRASRTEAFSTVQTIPPMAFGNRFEAELVVSPDRRFVYATLAKTFNFATRTNRLVRFRVTAESQLAMEDEQQFFEEIVEPAFTTSGDRALTASPASDQWALLDRDVMTGAFSLAPEQLYDGAPAGTQGLGTPTLSLSPSGNRLVALSPVDQRFVLFDVMPDGRMFPAPPTLEARAGTISTAAVFGHSDDRFYVIDNGSLDIWERDPGAGAWSRRQGAPFGLEEPAVPLKLQVSPDRRFLYVGWQGLSPGVAWGITVYEIQTNGDLALAHPAISFSSGFLFRLVLSDAGDFIYGLDFGFRVLRRNAADGALTLVEHYSPPTYFTDGVGLPTGDVLVHVNAPENGLVLLRHGSDDRLTEVQRFLQVVGAPTTGVGGNGRNVLAIPTTNRYINLVGNDDNRHAILSLDRSGQLVYDGFVTSESLSSPIDGQAVFSPDGKTLYVPSSTLNAVTVNRINATFGNGFEEPIVAIEPAMAPPR